MKSIARKDGFLGQRMVVVPRRALGLAETHPLLAGLHPTDAGFFPCAKRHGIERPSGAPGAILILCREGRGWVRFGRAAPRAVEAGEAVLIGPRQPHAYGADQAHPWTIQWTHFEGVEVPEWWRWHHLPKEGGILRLRAGVLEQLDLGRVHETLGESAQGLLLASAALRWALANLTRVASHAESGASARRAVEQAEAWMREHCAGRVTLAALARRAALSPSHFSALFRSRFGAPPIDYFLRLKMRRARDLLETTDWPIRRIAEEVGVPDALYFSRRFRAATGRSPRAHRRATRSVV